MYRKSYLFCVSTIVCAVLGFSTKAMAASPKVTRLSGNDRYGTSFQISKDGWQQSEYAVIATGEDYPDALCAAPLAKKLRAPIILTSKNSLDSANIEEIQKLGVSNVYVIGGTGVVSANVEKTLSDMGIKVTRLAGKDRYDTSVKIAEQLDAGGEIVVATGNDFPDALSIAPIAAKEDMPILLSPKSEIADVVQKYISTKNITKTYIVGGAGVISDTAAAAFPNSERIFGNDRYETNTKVINRFSNDIDFSTIYMATGQDFPDALAGSALATKTSSPIVLVGPKSTEYARNMLAAKIPSASALKVLGGYGAVSDMSMLSAVGENYLGNTAGNISNLAFAAEEDGFVYYNDLSTNHLYKMKPDGTEKVKISDDDAAFIKLKDGWIYYSNGNDETKLYKIKTDGTGRKCLSSKSALYVYAMEDYIYYYDPSEGSNIFRIKNDGTEEKAFLNITGNDTIAVDIVIAGDYIYYTELGSFNIFRVRPDGSERTLISKDAATGLVKSGDYIFYCNNSDEGKLYKIKCDGTQRSKVEDSVVIGLNVSGDWIYYSYCANKDNPEIGGKLYKIKTDGTSKTLLLDQSSYAINIVGDYIYYINLSKDEAVESIKKQ